MVYVLHEVPDVPVYVESVDIVDVTMFRLTVWIRSRRTRHDNASRDALSFRAISSDVSKHAVDGYRGLCLDKAVNGGLPLLRYKRRALSANEEQKGREGIESGM
jgi:hypothetical protein